MTAGLWRGLAGLSVAGLLACLGPAAASARQAQLSYVGYLAGAPVLSLEASITVPEGAKPGDGAYFVSADIATLGNLALLYPFTQTVADAAIRCAVEKNSRWMRKATVPTLTRIASQSAANQATEATAK